MLQLDFLNSTNCCVYQALVSSQDYVACSSKNNSNIEIWTVKKPQEESVVLLGHHRTVTALALGHQPKETYLCSCSSDNIILWDLLQNDGHPDRGKVLLSNVTLPSCALFSCDNSLIIVCCESEILKFNLSTSSFSSIDSLTCDVNNCQILSVDMIATTGDDSFFRVWNLEKSEIVNQRLISPGFPCAMVAHSSSCHIAIATSVGYLYILGDDFVLIRNFRIWSLVKGSLDKYLRNTQNYANTTGDLEDTDCNTIIHLHMFSIPNTLDPLQRLSPDILYVIVITTTCLLIVNLNIEECVYFLNFMEPALIGGVEKSLGLMRLASVVMAPDNLSAHITLIPVFGKSNILLKFHLGECCKQISFQSEGSGILSFLSSEVIPDTSYLKAETGYIKALAKAKKASSVSINPLTFHSTIKSSGYGTQYRSAMFQQSKPKARNPRPLKSEFSSAVQRVIDGQVFFKDQRPELLSSCRVNTSSSIVSARLSVNGKRVLCANNDGTTDILKLEDGNCSVVTSVSCHQGAVNSINLSHCGKLFVTSGADHTAKLWRLWNRNQIPLLNIGLPGKGKATQSRSPFAEDQSFFEDGVTQVLFYYLDQFILLSSKNNLFMFSYFIKDHKTELKRFNNLSYCTLRVTIPVDCQRITAFRAVNQFYSNLILCSGTSKGLDVLDMNTAQVVWHAHDVSSKPPYLILLNEGSVNSQQSTTMYDIFLTASLMDGIKLWDLRTKSPVIKYREHTASTIPCGLSFSSCGKYIAAGSEDKGVYIYDLRSTTSLYRLCDPSDVVTSALFHPDGSQILAATLNGTIYVYGLK